MILTKASAGCVNGALYGGIGGAKNSDVKSLKEMFGCFTLALQQVEKESGFAVFACWISAGRYRSLEYKELL